MTINLRTAYGAAARASALALAIASRLVASGLVATLAVVAACGDTTDPDIAQLNFDRPVDVSFACYGGLRILGDNGTPDLDDAVEITAQPIEACNVRSLPRRADEPVPMPPGQETLPGGFPVPAAKWFGFILQSGPGTVAIAVFDTKPASAFGGGDVNVLDADPLTPGDNGISVGEDPIGITADDSACWQVIANAGSCDLSALDVTSALDASPGTRVVRNAVKNAAGVELDARPAAIALAPGTSVIGERCPANPRGVAYISYPGCHLVAAVDLSTSTIVGGVRFDASGPSVIPQADLATLTCPSECAGGATVTTGVRPRAIDVEAVQVTVAGTTTTEERLLIGAEDSNVVTLVELTESTSLPASVQPIPLEDPSGDLGVTSLALAPTIGMGGSQGMINDASATGGQLSFAYAIATDHSIRVIALNGATETGGALVDFVECDTQVDPRLIYGNRSVRELSCFPVGRPGTPARRAGARGPGIRLPSDDAIPISLDVFRSDGANDTRSPGPTKLVGYFAVVAASNGRVFVINVDDDNYFDFEDRGAPLQVALTQAIAHQVRDAIPARERKNVRVTTDAQGNVVKTELLCNDSGPDPDGQEGNIGGARSTGTPVRNINAAVIHGDKAPALPAMRALRCQGVDSTRPIPEIGFQAPDEVREQVYGDLQVLRDEIWTLTWEGSLSLDRQGQALDGPPVRTSQMVVDGNGMRLVDQSQPYCEAGVEPYDIVQLRGCDPAAGDGDCPIGYRCYVHPDSPPGNSGTCMLDDEAERLATACKDFFTSKRRYTVRRSSSGELRLLPRKVVLPTTPIDGCTSDAQCEDLGRYAAELAQAGHPRDLMTDDPTVWQCLEDADRRPLDQTGQTGKRCVAVCRTEGEKCDAGQVCRDGICMESVMPPQACVNAPQQYELLAGDAFTVHGTISGYVHSLVRDPATAQCIQDPAAHPWERGRIPLVAAACDPTADPLTGRLPDGTFEPNPCAMTVEHTEQIPVYANDTCALAEPPAMVATRDAPAIRFRNRGLALTVVDPWSPGDANCNRDRKGNLGKIPLVFPGYQITWRQAGGFIGHQLGRNEPAFTPAFPTKIVRGPTQSVWVIDEGDYLSTTIGLPSTRGKVFRFEISGVNVLNKLE